MHRRDTRASHTRTSRSHATAIGGALQGACVGTCLPAPHPRLQCVHQWTRAPSDIDATCSQPCVESKPAQSCVSADVCTAPSSVRVMHETTSHSVCSNDSKRLSTCTVCLGMRRHTPRCRVLAVARCPNHNATQHSCVRERERVHIVRECLKLP